MSAGKRNVAVVTDSSSSMTQEMGQEYGVQVVPLYVTFESQTYRDGIDLDPTLFYQLLQSSRQLPTTSQPTPADFAQTYARLAEQSEAIVSIHISSLMSGTVESATMASRQVPGVPIHVIDSRSVSMGLGLLAIAAARAAAAGQDAAEGVRLVQRLIPKMNVIFTVDTLEYMRKGGRIGGATALLGSILDIKPVLCMRNGRAEPLEKQRTKKRAVSRLLELLDEQVGSSGSVHAAVVHGMAPEAVQDLAGRVTARLPSVDLITAEFGPILGTHVGPGTIGIAYYCE
jgi:DegV family protein with EDD domain